MSPGTLVSSTNKADCHDITEILLEVALNPNLNLKQMFIFESHVTKNSPNQQKYIYKLGASLIIDTNLYHFFSINTFRHEN